MSCAEKWLSRKVVGRTRISLVFYTEPELIPLSEAHGRSCENASKDFFPSVCGAVQSHLSLESQGAEFECGCQSHTMKITFNLVGLPLIQPVSCLRVDMVYFSDVECSLFFFFPGLARAKYTWEANCIIIKNMSYMQPKDVKSVSWLCLLT